MRVIVEVNRRNVVTGIENNVETDQFRKLQVEVGQKLENEFLILLMMNPNRFQIIRTR